MLWTDQEVNEAKSKPASEVPWLDEGPYLNEGAIRWLIDETIKSWPWFDEGRATELGQMAAAWRQRD